MPTLPHSADPSATLKPTGTRPEARHDRLQFGLHAPGFAQVGHDEPGQRRKADDGLHQRAPPRPAARFPAIRDWEAYGKHQQGNRVAGPRSTTLPLLRQAAR